MNLFKKRSVPTEMSEEERLAHEAYLAELTAQNQKTVKKVCAVLWCVAMAAWAILLVLDVMHQAGEAKILFHGVAAAITALLALRRVVDFFAAKNNKDDT